jgi:hypothetical protein
MSSEFLARNEFRRTTDPASKARKRPWRSVIVTGLAVTALLGGTGAAAAAGGSGAPGNAGAVTAAKIAAPAQSQPGPGTSGGMHGYGRGWIMPVHGQVVVAKPGGGYQTLDFQRGSVTTVSSAAITVKSTDGFTQGYAVTGSTIVTALHDGIGSVKAGDEAVVIATVSGHTVSAARIIDITQVKASHQQFGFGGGGSS